MDALSDADLVARCRNGDVLAFEALYERHAPRLYSLACRMLGSAAEAEDLLQESFLKAHRKLNSFRGESSLATWLYRLAMNECLDHLRSRGAKATGASAPLEQVEGRYRPGGSTQTDLVVNRLDLERALARLPDGCRAAFVLHDIEGFEHREVAAILGVAEGTSKSQLHKARLRLRELLSGGREAQHDRD